MSAFHDARRVRRALGAANDAVGHLSLALGGDDPHEVARCAGLVQAAAERLIDDAGEADTAFRAAATSGRNRDSDA